MRRLIPMVILAATAACSGNDPAPTAPTPAAPVCQTQNTAQVSFENRSSGSTYTVVWDGASILSLTPSQTSPAQTVAAGVPHSLVFLYSNTRIAACTVSTPTLAACQSEVFYCTY